MKDEFAIKPNYYKRSATKEKKRKILEWRNQHRDTLHLYYERYRDKYDKGTSPKRDMLKLNDTNFITELIKKLKEFIEEIK